MARTATRGTGGLAGGMRGSKANELIVVQPRPSFWTVMATNACRLLTRLVLWATRHPAGAGSLVLVVVLWVWLGPLGLTAVIGCATASLAAWRCLHPATFRRVVVSRWRAAWVYRRCWQPAMHTCGLSVDLHGREYLPRVRRVVAGECVDQVQVELLSGQSPSSSRPRCPSWRTPSRPAAAGSLWRGRDPLNTRVAALAPTTEPDLERLPIGRCEDGGAWRLRLLGTHLLVAGATGSGKGSVVWSLIRALGPAIRDRSVQVWAIDPKGGMELTPGQGLFTRFAYADTESMVLMLEDAVVVMRERAERLRCAGRRSHTPSPHDPLILVVVDEMAALTAYCGDRDLKKRAEAALQLLLSQGRAPGVLVVAAVQDPGKDVIGFRDLFPSRIALRLLEDVQVDMVLGRSARQRGAECDRIPASLPAVGYVVLEGVREPVRVRAAYVSDADLAAMVEDYRPGMTPDQVERRLQLVDSAGA